jgi:hypothetical protein
MNENWSKSSTTEGMKGKKFETVKVLLSFFSRHGGWKLMGEKWGEFGNDGD